MEDLYLSKQISFDKVGSEVNLPEDASKWPQEILQELYKKVPYIADFHPDVSMETVNAEQGYGFGHFEVQNKTEAPGGVTPEQEQAIGIQHVRIPILVKDFRLQPFDVLVTADSKMLPLTESRLRQALFRPQSFDVTSRTPGDQSLIGQLYPPYRQNYGYGGGAGLSMSADMGKSAEELMGYLQKSAEETNKKDLVIQIADVLGVDPKSVAHLAAKPVQTLGTEKTGAPSYPVSDAALTSSKIKDLVPKMPKVEKVASLLDRLQGSIYEEDYAKLAEEMTAPEVQAAYLSNVSSPSVLSKLARLATISKEARLGRIPPMQADAMQLERVPGGYHLKVASSHCWDPCLSKIDRSQAIKLVGEKIVLAADVTGAVTMSEGPEAIGGSPAETKPELISSFGIYKVQTQDGKELVGFVIPNLIDMDGSSVPLALFTNGSESALQGDIAGEPSGTGTNLPTSYPQGHGFFYRTLPNGMVEATVPMEVQGGLGEGQFSAESFDGKKATIAIQPNVKRPVFIDDTLVLPEGYVWSALDQSNEVELVSVPGQLSKQAFMRQRSVVRVRGDAEVFSFEGPAIDKLAREDTSFLGYNDALFLLAALGTQQCYGAEKLAEAVVSSRPVEIEVSRYLTPADEFLAAYNEKVAAAHMELPKYCLVKEAAFLPDPSAIDTVLSLGFLNPENIHTFISHLPHLERIVGMLCELLIAARLGLRELPADVLERVVKSMEIVVEALKGIAFTEQTN